MTVNDLKFGDILIYENGKKMYLDYGETRYINQIGSAYIPLGRKLENEKALLKVQRYSYKGNAYTDTNFDKQHEVYWLETIYERKEILDKKEKEYLSAVIKPFRNKIKFIRKSETVSKKEFIVIEYEDSAYPNRAFLPTFRPNEMYRGMQLEKEYDLEELGL